MGDLFLNRKGLLMYFKEIKKIQEDAYNGSEFNTACSYNGTLRLVNCGEKQIVEAENSEDDLFLENDPVYIGKYESEILLNFNRKQKDNRK